MSWKTSDRALCIVRKPWHDAEGNPPTGPLPQRDVVYLVLVSITWCNVTYLQLIGFEGRWYDEADFRRIVPLSDQKREQAEEQADQTVRRAIDQSNQTL